VAEIAWRATAAAGIRYKGRTDVLLALFDKGTTVAGVFTRSKCPSAPVEWCRAKLKGGKARALVVNSGNANAFTGKTGREADRAHRKDRRQGGRLRAGEVFLASTGVIGEPLDAASSTACWTAGAQRAAPGAGSTPPRRS
jgi:glutamate N-acetyltransferase/amino-acid N-acetyltransferase